MPNQVDFFRISTLIIGKFYSVHIEIHMITYLIRSCTRSHLQYKQWTNVDHPVTFMNFNCLFRPACRFFAWSYVDRFLSWFWGQKGQKRCISKYIQEKLVVQLWSYKFFPIIPDSIVHHLDCVYNFVLFHRLVLF